MLETERDYSRQLQGLAQASLSITAARTLEAKLEITNAARAIIDAHQSVTSMTRGPDWSQAISAISLSDKYAKYRSYDRIPDGSGIYAEVCRTNYPMRMTQPELEAHTLWRKFGKEAGRHPPMNGWLAVPLIAHDGHNLGLIQLSDKREGEFMEEDEAILVQLAQFASVVIEKAQGETALEGVTAESERRKRLYETILSNTPDLVYVFDFDYRFTFANQALLEMWGRTLEDSVGKSLLEIGY